MQRVIVFALLILGFALGGCSPGSFFGSDRDLKLKEGTLKGNLSPQCQGLDLAVSQISATTFRKVISCWNSNQSIDPVQRLVNQLSDEELAPLLGSVNKSFLAKPETVYQLDQVFDQLEKTGAHEPFQKALSQP